MRGFSAENAKNSFTLRAEHVIMQGMNGLAQKPAKSRSGREGMIDHESEEMYLETVLVLKGEKAVVRSIDVAERLGYAKSSVSRGVNNLRDKGYIVIDDDGFIGFTEEGAAKAERIYERHKILTSLFVELGADEKLAESNACRIEHVIDDEIFELLKKHINKS